MRRIALLLIAALIPSIAFAGGSTAPGIVQGGSVTPGNCAQFSASGVAIDAGSTCGTGTAGVIQSQGTAGKVLVNGDTGAHTGATTYSLPDAVTIGTPSTAGGSVTLNGLTTGSAGVSVAANAGTTTFQLPVGNGTSGFGLETDGSGHLSYVQFLAATNNLSDLASASTARTNLGLGTAAVQNTSAFLQPSNNLSDVSSASTSRTNLGLGTAATQNLSAFLQPSNNLSDVSLASTARTNLGLGTAATQNTGTSGATLGLLNASLTFGGSNAYGTPTSITLTNATGLPLGGITGFGASVATWLGTPSSANLLAALTTKTGTGNSVFGTAPTLSAPTISGAPTFSGVPIFSGLSTGTQVSCMGLDVSNNLVLNAAACGTGSGGGSAFNAITGGTNTTAAMVVGTGATLSVSGSGTIGATTLLGQTWANPGTIGGGTAAAGHFTSFSATGALALSGLSSGTQVSCMGLDSGNNVVLALAACGSGGGGGGTVGSGTAGQVAAYPSSGTSVQGYTLGGNNFVVDNSGHTVNLTSPNRSAASGATIGSGDIGGQVNSTDASAATFTQPSTGTAGAGQGWIMTDQAAGVVTLSGGQTLNGLAATTLHQGGWAACTGNGTNADCFGFPGFGALSGDATATAAGVTTVSKVNGDANVAFLDANQSFTKGQAVTPLTTSPCGTQSPAGTMTMDFSLSNSCVATFGAGNLTIANPTNIKAGQGFVLKLIQDSTGSRTASWGTDFKWTAGSPPTLATAANSYDVISCWTATTGEINCSDGSGGATAIVAAATTVSGTCASGDNLYNNAGVVGCQANGGGGGTVTTSGSPASGNLTKFSSASAITNGDLSGDVATSGTLATTIQSSAVTTSKINNGAVTLGKIANASANSVLVGSGASGSGSSYAEIALGTNLSMSGTTLSVASSAALAGSPTTTTQSANDNSTKIATTAYVDRPIPLPTPGSSATLAAPREYFACTTTCTITVPVPAAGYEFCVFNDDNVSTVITLAALGSSAMYENSARTAYGTAGTGTMVSGGAVGDRICILGRDATHYFTTTVNGTWTAS